MRQFKLACQYWANGVEWDLRSSADHCTRTHTLHVCPCACLSTLDAPSVHISASFAMPDLLRDHNFVLVWDHQGCDGATKPNSLSHSSLPTVTTASHAVLSAHHMTDTDSTVRAPYTCAHNLCHAPNLPYLLRLLTVAVPSEAAPYDALQLHPHFKTRWHSRSEFPHCSLPIGQYAMPSEVMSTIFSAS